MTTVLKHPILEVIVTVLIAAFAYWGPFKSPDLSLTIATIGGLLSLGRYGLSEVLKEDRKLRERLLLENFDPVKKLQNYFDISSQAMSLSNLKNVNESYIKIVDQEFKEAKEEIISEALEKLNTILNEKRTEELSTGEYYNNLLNLLKSVGQNEIVYAVSTGEELEWDDSAEEDKFFGSNMNIASNGGKVIRYFVFPTEKFEKAKKENEKIAAHFKGSSLQGFHVDKDTLESKDPSLYNSIGQGFLMIDKRIAIVDVFGSRPPRLYNKNRDKLDKYWKAIQQLEKLAT